jgi:plasmid maintenance system antidote protein VapI
VLETNILSTEKDWFSRPGESVLSAMRRRAVTAEMLAKQLDGGMAEFRGIIAGTNRIGEQAAEAISKALGGSPRFWISRQANYESALALAVNAVSEDDANFWLKEVPLPGPKPRGKLGPQAREAEIEKRLAFFGVSTIGSWRARYGSNQKAARFRSSSTHSHHEGATSLWLRQGELEASIASTRPWSPEALKARLPQIRALSRRSKPERFFSELRALFAEAGVAFVFLRAPEGCRASGASRLVADDKAMLLVSFRYRSDDQFWFTVFHEIGHLLLHDATPFVDEDGTGEEDPCEREANEFAAQMIVPELRLSELESLPADEDMIRRFAISLGVAPGLILGQLEHRGLPHGRFRNLRRTWSWKQIEGAASL